VGSECVTVREEVGRGNDEIEEAYS
jgi:hypothetical protein